jgi:hypothetical protein
MKGSTTRARRRPAWPSFWAAGAGGHRSATGRVDGPVSRARPGRAHRCPRRRRASGRGTFGLPHGPRAPRRRVRRRSGPGAGGDTPPGPGAVPARGRAAPDPARHHRSGRALGAVVDDLPAPVREKWLSGELGPLLGPDTDAARKLPDGNAQCARRRRARAAARRQRPVCSPPACSRRCSPATPPASATTPGWRWSSARSRWSRCWPGSPASPVSTRRRRVPGPSAGTAAVCWWRCGTGSSGRAVPLLGVPGGRRLHGERCR